MLKPTLDPRLLTAADFFPYCEHGADIGADHGHLSCYLLASGKCQHMQVTDISASSLEKAKALLKRHQLDNQTEFCVGDGLNALNHPADAIAICGMGGHTLAEILQNGKERLCGATLIVSPQTEQMLVRTVIHRELEYHIEKEVVVKAANRFYVMMRAVPGYQTLDDRLAYLGPGLITCDDPVYAEFLKWRLDVVSCERDSEAAIRLKWLKEEHQRVLGKVDQYASNQE